jgi:hypothetical protein
MVCVTMRLDLAPTHAGFYISVMALTSRCLHPDRCKKAAAGWDCLLTPSFGYSAQDSFFDLDPVFESVRQLIGGGINAMLVMSGHAPPRVRRSIARFGLESGARFPRLSLAG